MSTVELCKPKYLLPILFVAAVGLSCVIVVLATGIVFMRRSCAELARLNEKVDGLQCVVENFCPDCAVGSFYKELDPYLTANMGVVRDQLIGLQCRDDLHQTSCIQSGGDVSTVLYDAAGAADGTPNNGCALTEQLKPKVSVSLKTKSPKKVALQGFNHALDVAESVKTECCDNVKQISVDNGIGMAYGVRGHPSGSSQNTERRAFEITTPDPSPSKDSLSGASVRSVGDGASSSRQYECGNQCPKTPGTVVELGDCDMYVCNPCLTDDMSRPVESDCNSPDFVESGVSFLNSLEKASKDLVSSLDASLVYASDMLSSFDMLLPPLSGDNDSVELKTSIVTSAGVLSVTESEPPSTCLGN
ncbi:hypothetical protein [Neorickettsia sennetsu]|uniref:Uncharacterized protein n=1 Tax=Ehrlichia sennetsu (strain ATCC VR-367 / Miyayama) TaxID=222891 RepID=Q2GEU2_EHRS3|nr:hypothetical protein [Neorickettsia sennetsu]ABD45895.1 hypothetical protein NSE_0104 [Neorickettsia sennetsu str. Miyayama]